MKKTAALCLALLTALSLPGATVPRPAPSTVSEPAEPAPVAAEAAPARPLDVVLGEPERSTPLAETAQAPAGPPPLPEPPPVHLTDLGVAPSVTSVRTLLQASADHLVRDDNSAQVRAVFDAINSYRASLGLGRVQYHATVAGMAQEWSDYIASREVIEHRPSFWTDPRALSPDRGAGEVIAVRWDRNAAEMVAWWKTSPAHNAILTDPRLNVMGIGVTFTDGTWQTTPTRYAMWGVVNLFGYSRLPAGTVSAPGGSPSPSPTPPPSPPPTQVVGTLPHAAGACPATTQSPVPADLRLASIRGPGDVVALDANGTVTNRPSVGTGSLGSPTTIATGLSGAVRLYTPDWNRDGVYDLLVQRLDGRVTLMKGRIAGGFDVPVALGLSELDDYGLGKDEWCPGDPVPPVAAQDTAGGIYLFPDRGSRDMAQESSPNQPALVSPPSTAPWRPLVTWRFVKGFVAGESGIVTIRTDGSAFYTPFAGTVLGAPRELGTSMSGLRLAG